MWFKQKKSGIQSNANSCYYWLLLIVVTIDSCYYWLYGKYEKLSKKEWLELGKSNVTWNCQNCAKNLLPFYSLDNDEFQEFLHGVSNKLNEPFKKCIALESDVQYCDAFSFEWISCIKIFNTCTTLQKICWYWKFL